MSEPGALAKTTRINLLFDFYEPLLTDKQRTFLKYYFHDNYSLGEIAAEFEISRQAVYEHIKRAEAVLESYETKLGLVAKHEALLSWLARLDEAVVSLPGEHAASSGLEAVARGLRQAVEQE
ncbi:MAG TPA: YlxM family DNA-binding protein [Paenibacillus sp.]|uniref:YlxM family DNA-binding protein n=1 Tax=Paenibacillus sp. TaxID=58172 RepID=UPI0028D06093|nr:YlxM family DNA-binding protein [Paenibacillus sp.]HUC91004.1 YlxM family DNA-binding protein [Paenibacillus sp.]